ncbi:MAG TPA: tetratricopeptide repeat protein [Candidatus Sulfotelmatobacter sp.]|nr:tetratricopeptide repeat protein [Candidatus Sulfotelmatobacter sp.]
MNLAVLVVLSIFVSLPASATVERDSLFETSSRQMQEGDYRGAEAGFLQVLRDDPNNVAALGNLGIVYTHLQRFTLAIKTYDRALRIRPNERGILLNAGLIYLRQDDYERARPYFRKLHSLNSKDVQATNLLATCMIYGGQPKAGIEMLKPLIANSPDNGTLYLMGIAYSRIGMEELGDKVFAQLFPEASTNPKSSFLLGQAHYDALQFATAERDFRMALAADPGLTGVHRALGKNYLSVHRYEDAEKEFRAALEQDPNDTSSSYFMGALLTQTDRFAESVPYLERAHEADPSAWATMFYLGKARLKLNELDASITALKSAADLNPNEAAVFYLLGTACRKAGRSAEARVAFQRVAELHKNTLDAQKKALQDQAIVGVR